MAYGFISTNSSGDTVVNDTDPQMVLARSGSASGSTNAAGVYEISMPSAAQPAAGEVVVYSVSVGNWISTSFTYNFLYSNVSSVSYYVFESRLNITTPTGYGMAVFDASGNCVWNAEDVVNRVNNAGVIPSSSQTYISYSNTVTGSTAVGLIRGNARVNLSNGDVHSMAAERTASSSWKLAFKKVDDIGPIGTGYAYYNSDLSYLMAVI